MGMNLGHPAPTEGPRVRPRQGGDRSEHDVASPPNREPNGENRRTRTGRDFGPLALIGLIISAVGLWRVGR
eukprot:3611579-Alexandrium_andersonii.AAC.1